MFKFIRNNGSFLFGLFGFLLVVGGIFGAFLSLSPANQQVSLHELNGTWESAYADTTIVALVKDGRIEIDFSAPGTSGGAPLYWLGSFTEENRNGNTFVSVKDDSKAVMSRADTKDFTYHNGELSFELRILGRTSMVDLVRK